MAVAAGQRAIKCVPDGMATLLARIFAPQCRTGFLRSQSLIFEPPRRFLSPGSDKVSCGGRMVGILHADASRLEFASSQLSVLIRLRTDTGGVRMAAFTTSICVRPSSF
jgi:hypothetical protein